MPEFPNARNALSTRSRKVCAPDELLGEATPLETYPPGQAPSWKSTDKDRYFLCGLVVKTGCSHHIDFWGPATTNIVDVPSEHHFGLVLGSCRLTLRSTGGVARPEELLAEKLL